MHAKLAKAVFVVLAMLASQLAAAAEPVWTIYTPAAGSAIYDILNGVAGMMQRGGEASIIGAVLTVSLVSFIALVARAGLEGNFVRVLTFFLSLWVLLTTTFSIKVPLMVADRVSNYYNVVENVPLILAAPAAFISQIGDSVSEKTDTWMSLPDEMSMYRGGQFNLFSKVLADSHTFKIVDPGLQQSMTNYVNDCVIPSIARGAISLSALKSSKDLWATMRVDHQSLMTRVRIEPTMVTGLQKTSISGEAAPSGGGAAATSLCSVSDTSGCTESLTTCTQAYSIIGAALSRYVAEFGKGGAGLGDLAASGSAGGIAGSLSAASTWLMGDNTEVPAPGQLLQQRIMVNAMSGTFRAAAVQAGNDALLQAAATTQVEEAQKSTWIASASLFNDLMGYIFVVLQAMIYALAPFALLMLFAPGSGIRGAITYLQMLVWVALWQPLITVINFIIAVLGRSTMATSFGTGFDMTNAVAVSEAANNLMAAAGFMGSMVPLLAWKVATGSFGLMEFVQQGSGQGSAAQAGSTASTGNLSIGNASMNNLSGNNAKLTHSTEFGELPLKHNKTGPGSIATVSDFGGSSSSMNGSGIQLSAGRKLEAGQEAALKSAASSDIAKSLVSSTAENMAQTQSQMKQHTKGTETATGETRTAQSTVSEGMSKQLSESAGALVSSLASLGYQHSYSGSFGAGLGARLGSAPGQAGSADPNAPAGADKGGLKPSLGAKLEMGGSVGMNRTTGLQDSSTASVDNKQVHAMSEQAMKQLTGASSYSYSAKDGLTLTWQDGSTYSMSAQQVQQATETHANKVEAAFSERKSSGESLTSSYSLPVADGKAVGPLPGVGSNAALDSALSAGHGGPSALLGSAPKGAPPAGTTSIQHDAATKIGGTHQRVAHDTMGSGGGGPGGSAMQSKAETQLHAATRPGQSTAPLSSAEQSRVKAGPHVESKTGGHTWNADDKVKADQKGKLN